MQFKLIFDSLEYYLFIAFDNWVNWLYKKVKKKKIYIYTWLFSLIYVWNIAITVFDLKQSSEK